MGQLIHRALIRMPTAAMAHTRARSRYPAEFPRTMRHTGVYVPAIRTKIIIWSIFRRSRLMPSEISKVW